MADKMQNQNDEMEKQDQKTETPESGSIGGQAQQGSNENQNTEDQGQSGDISSDQS